MMIVLLLLFAANDSLPPSPDLSSVVFPEPPLYRSPRTYALDLGWYGGDISGANGTCDTKYFAASALYEQRTEWDTVRAGYYHVALNMSYDRFWLSPSLSGFILQHQHDYVYTSPRIAFSSPTPWAIVWGQSSLDLWKIDESHQFEQQTAIEMIFDKMIYTPHFEITGLYTGSRMKSEAAWNMHIQNVHVTLRSPIAYDFPAPSLTIQYRDPLLTIKGIVRSGVVYHSLISYFDPDLPVAYTTSVPEESLRISGGFTVAADLYSHTISIEGVYENWYNKVSVADGFVLAAAADVQEFRMNLTASDSLHIGLLSATNTVSVQYHWSDTALALLPDWAVQDTITGRLAALDARFIAQYRSLHDGIGKPLPEIFRMDSEIGVHAGIFRLFFRVNNVTDVREEWYDGFFLKGRQYGGGVEFKYLF